MRWVVAFLLLSTGVLASAGCLDRSDPSTTFCEESSEVAHAEFAAFQDGIDARQPQDVLSIAWGLPPSHRLSESPMQVTGQGAGAATSFSDGNGTSLLQVFNYEFSGSPASTVSPALNYSIQWDADECMGHDDHAWTQSAPLVEGSLAAAGAGAQVYTAGFWENGTLFYTNMAHIDALPIPRAGWYEWGGDAPLPVYIYDQDRTEQPIFWHAPSSQVPPTGSPADPAISDAFGAVEGGAGLGYFTTIPGFNEALKGLSTTSSRVVWVAAEDAYTRPGNEEHDLYGDPIIFFIDVLAVDPVPCPGALEPGICDTPA